MPDKDIINVTVVGSGNVAEALALAISRVETLSLRQVVSRNGVRAAQIAQTARCPWCDDFTQAAAADVYIIAVSDRAVGEVASQLHAPEGSMVLHTAGSVEMDILQPYFAAYGVLYPFQTFTAGRKIDFAEIPLFVEGSDAAVEERITEFASRLSCCVQHSSSQRRSEIHLAGVVACNFVNALYAMACERLREREGLSFDVLRPLILETASKAAAAGDPHKVQTGPAVRNDRAVVERHMAMLDDERQKEIYKLLTEYIWETSKKI